MSQLGSTSRLVRVSAPSPSESRTPIELWLFIAGVVAYSAAPLLPWLSFLRFPQNTLFAAATALGVIVSRNWRVYWATVVIVGMTIGLPFLKGWLIPTRYELTSLDVAWLVVPPVLLVALLFTPRVRRFVAQPDRADEVVSTRCSWCNRAEGALEEVVVSSPKGLWFGRPSVPSEYWVHPEHRAEFLAWHEKKQRHASHLQIALFGSFGGAVLGVAIAAGIGVPILAVVVCGALIVALGIVYLVLPFGDLSTIRWLGLHRAIAIGRWTGAGLVLVGLSILLFALRIF